MIEELEKRAKSRCKEILLSTIPGQRSNQQIKYIQEYATLSKTFPPALDDHHILDDLCQNMVLLIFEANTILFLEGEDASCYYITFSGAIDILQTHEQQAVEKNLQLYGDKIQRPLGSEFNRSKLGGFLCRYSENKGFGELALMHKGGKRAASAFITIPSDVLQIGLDVYVRTLRSFHIDQVNIGETFEIIRSHRLAEGLTGRALTKIAYAMQSINYSAHAKICDEGDRIEHIVLVNSGEIKELKLEQDVQLELATIGKGSMIGAVDILRAQKKYSCGYIAVTAVHGFSISLEIFAIIVENKETVKKFLSLEASRVKFNRNLHNSKAKAQRVLHSASRQESYKDFLSHNLNLVDEPGNREAEKKIADGLERSREHLPAMDKSSVIILESDQSTPPLKQTISTTRQGYTFKVQLPKGTTEKKQSSASIIYVQAPPDLKTKPNQGKIDSTSVLRFFRRNKITPSLGTYMGNSSAVSAYSNEDKRDKSGRYSSSRFSVEDLLSDLEDVVSNSTMLNLTANSRENSIVRSRQSSFKSTRSNSFYDETFSPANKNLTRAREHSNSRSNLHRDDRARSLEKSNSRSNVTRDDRARSLEKSNSRSNVNGDDRARSLETTNPRCNVNRDDRAKSFEKSNSRSNVNRDDRARSLEKSYSRSNVNSDDQDTSFENLNSRSNIQREECGRSHQQSNSRNNVAREERIRENSILKVKSHKLNVDRLSESSLPQNPADRLCVLSVEECLYKPNIRAATKESHECTGDMNKIRQNVSSPAGHKVKILRENKSLLKQKVHLPNLAMDNEINSNNTSLNPSPAFQTLAYSPVCATDKHIWTSYDDACVKTCVFFGENVVIQQNELVEPLISEKKSKEIPLQLSRNAPSEKKPPTRLGKTELVINVPQLFGTPSTYTSMESPGVEIRAKTEKRIKREMGKEISASPLIFKRGNSCKASQSQKDSAHLFNETASKTIMKRGNSCKTIPSNRIGDMQLDNNGLQIDTHKTDMPMLLPSVSEPKTANAKSTVEWEQRGKSSKYLWKGPTGQRTDRRRLEHAHENCNVASQLELQKCNSAKTLNYQNVEFEGATSQEMAITGNGVSGLVCSDNNRCGKNRRQSNDIAPTLQNKSKGGPKRRSWSNVLIKIAQAKRTIFQENSTSAVQGSNAPKR